MNAFVKVIKEDPKVRVKINDSLERYMILTLEYQSKIGSDCLIQNIILKKIINLMGKTFNNRFRYRI